MSINNNIYYNPDKCGLEILATLDERDLSYQYNTYLVVIDLNSRRIFRASDSGCSCPVPFENYYFKSANKNNLEEITKHNFEQFETEIAGFPSTKEEKQKMINIVKEYLII